MKNKKLRIYIVSLLCSCFIITQTQALIDLSKLTKTDADVEHVFLTTIEAKKKQLEKQEAALEAFEKKHDASNLALSEKINTIRAVKVMMLSGSLFYLQRTKRLDLLSKF